MNNSIDLMFQIPWALTFFVSFIVLLLASGFRSSLIKHKMIVVKYYNFTLVIGCIILCLLYSQFKLDIIKSEIEKGSVITINGEVDYVKHFNGTEKFSISGVVFEIEPGEIYCFDQRYQILESTTISVSYIDLSGPFLPNKKCIINIAQTKGDILK